MEPTDGLQMIIQFETFDIGAQRKLVETAIGLFLHDLGDQLQGPAGRQARAADDAIAAFWHGEYERALTFICAGECTRTPPTSASTNGSPSLRELWRRYACTRSPV